MGAFHAGVLIAIKTLLNSARTISYRVTVYYGFNRDDRCAIGQLSEALKNLPHMVRGRKD